MRPGITEVDVFTSRLLTVYLLKRLDYDFLLILLTERDIDLSFLCINTDFFLEILLSLDEVVAFGFYAPFPTFIFVS